MSVIERMPHESRDVLVVCFNLREATMLLRSFADIMLDENNIIVFSSIRRLILTKTGYKFMFCTENELLRRYVGFRGSTISGRWLENAIDNYKQEKESK